MSYYGKSNRLFVERSLDSGNLRDSQIVECDLSDIRVENILWDHTDIRDLHANDIQFINAQLKGSIFFRSSFMRAQFLASSLSNMTIDGLTLIKSRWQQCVLNNVTLRNNCLQRANFTRSRVVSSSLIDFEALNAMVDNCVFSYSIFSIGYGSGMNGLSGATISNCIFYNCRFQGFPLRGAVLRSNVFAHCFGEIADEIDCGNVAGLGSKGSPGYMPVTAPNEASRLLSRLTQ